MMVAAGKLRAWLVLLLVCTLGIVIRLAIPADDFTGLAPMPFPDDPPYHLLRVEGLVGSPNADTKDIHDSTLGLGAMDPMIAHPFGDRCIWPWGFDWLAATLIPDDACDRGCVSRVAGLVPVGVSVITAVFVFLLAARLGRSRGWGSGAVTGRADHIAIASAALFIMMPAHVSYSLAGRFDHHVMEPLFVLMPLVIAADGGRHGLKRLAAGGLACGLSAAFFPAAPAISFPVFVVVGALLSRPAGVVAWCAGMLVGLALSLLASPAPLDWVHYSPSVWHIATAVCLSSGLVGFKAVKSFVAGHRLPPIQGFMLAAVTGTTAVAVATGLTHLLFPGWIPAIIDGFRYASSSGFAALSLEASSFFDDPLRMMDLTGWLFVPGLIGLYALALPSPAGRRRPVTVAFIAISAALVCLAAAQRRFLVAATPLIAISAACGLDVIASAAVRGDSMRARRVRVLLAVVGTFLLIAVSLNSIVGIQYLTPRDRAMYSAASTIAESDGNERGTMAPWGYGHLFKYAAGAPTVCDNFFGVPGADAALKRCLSLLYSTDADHVVKTLDELRIRFVVLVPPHPDQIRVETALLGLEPDDWVDADDRLSPLFAKSFFGRTGAWASSAAVGESGPWNMKLRGRFRQIDPATRQVEAEVLLLEHVQAEPR